MMKAEQKICIISTGIGGMPLAFSGSINVRTYDRF